MRGGCVKWGLCAPVAQARLPRRIFGHERMTEVLKTREGRRIAFNRVPGQGPGVVFLGGFKSDMQGTKAVFLEEWARREGRAFLRFDYSGHGESEGAFEDGAIGDWFLDARAVIEELTEGPQVLVGSSMGGWISLLVARAMSERVAGLVTIAAAPDFTEQGFWAGFDAEARERLLRDGRLELPSEYGDEPYVITRRLIEEGRDQLVMNQPLSLPFPVRFLQGTADEDVPVDWATALLNHAEGPDMRLLLVKGADHRFSTPDCLAAIVTAIDEVSGR
ncbi:pimeloyl-ACP methyl ester carboxylesterase [Paracoccus sulfuroxidans]|uniref:Palmitoyl-protein thioesterase ABHD10, mitochondrial n=2 Tax=Paracoccus sulfuroxidans TaxID=384678 RepID=A0A562P1B5_9RHOB|nr:pimeloyl-ACP methyl ester carboxylesterase [Paracoccus sulfuroxidans]